MLESRESLESDRSPTDNYPTLSSLAQHSIESTLINIFSSSSSSHPLEISRYTHFKYLESSSRTLPQYYSSLDASRTWLVYWILHSLELLNQLPVVDSELTRFIEFLGICQNLESGGFGGGPGQLSHLAPSYAAVMALTTIGNEFAYRAIDRKKMYRFLMSLKQKDGSFVMHEQGEVDVRASFCALAIASVCNLLTEELVENCGDFLVKCQTYEGGFGGEPGNEAHGGYTFCSVAALKILGETHKIRNRERLMKWAIDRQMNLEGGFQGRTNKLVDGCYSFWVGGIFAIFQEDFFGKGDEEKENSWLFDEDKLQRYLIQACQHPKGGLIDKPGKSADLYHTCYCLSGMSIAQHQPDGRMTVFGDQSRNTLAEIDAVHNISKEKLARCKEYFGKLEKYV